MGGACCSLLQDTVEVTVTFGVFSVDGVTECSSNECAAATREVAVVLEGRVDLSMKNLPSS